MSQFSLISPAHAQGLSGILSGTTQFAPLVLIFAVFYFLLIRPQQQKQKEMRGMLASLKPGDRVVTGGGILGTVQRVLMIQDAEGKQAPSNEIEVEIASNLRVIVLRETITSMIKSAAEEGGKLAKGRVPR